jgi:radical SAM protein with 4Fe4S-binding SPASM domain
VREIVYSSFKKCRPLSVLVELTRNCNLSCRHCFNVKEKRRELTFSELKNIFSQLASENVLFLTFSGGEPFLRSDVQEITTFARKMNFAVRFFTNGTLIDEETAEFLAKANVLEVGVSLYGISEIHDYITQVEGSFEESIRALKLLKERNVKTVVKFTLMKLNVGELKKVKKLAKELGAEFHFGYVVTPKIDGSKEPLDLRVVPTQIDFLLESGEIPSPLLPKVRLEKYTDSPLCSAGRDMCAITAYGDLIPCLTIPKKYGNLKKDSFKKLWNSQEFEELRRKKKRDVVKCSSCNLISICVRCPGLSLLEEGDMLSPSQFACEMAEAMRSYLERRSYGKNV